MSLTAAVAPCFVLQVRFRVITLDTELALAPGVPMHGEVCPQNWIFHRLFVPDTNETHYAGGVRFHVHVHQGDVYYMLSRWSKTPGFSACNENEVSMSGKTDGQLDLCHITEKLDEFAASHGGIKSGESPNAAAVTPSGSRRRSLAGSSTSTRSHADADVDPVGNSSIPKLQGYIGLYGGTSCAHYTVEATFLPASNASCSNATTGTCKDGHH